MKAGSILYRDVDGVGGVLRRDGGPHRFWPCPAAVMTDRRGGCRCGAGLVVGPGCRSLTAADRRRDILSRGAADPCRTTSCTARNNRQPTL